MKIMKDLKHLCFLLLLVPALFYGQKYKTRSGVVKFEASVASYEEVAATNKTVSAILDASNGEVGVVVLMKGFRFKLALMEEHFNESYAETGKYPKATFKGKIEGFDAGKLTATPQSYKISGELLIHGKTKNISNTVKLSRSGGNLVMTGAFALKPSEFDIEIPGVIRKKIAETVDVNYEFSLSK